MSEQRGRFGVDPEWQQASRGGTREDRVLRGITVSMPPLIGDRVVPVEATLASALKPVMRAIADLDSTHGADLAGGGDAAPAHRVGRLVQD